jgi:hypothetical protein
LNGKGAVKVKFGPPAKKAAPKLAGVASIAIAFVVSKPSPLMVLAVAIFSEVIQAVAVNNTQKIAGVSFHDNPPLKRLSPATVRVIPRTEPVNTVLTVPWAGSYATRAGRTIGA